MSPFRSLKNNITNSFSSVRAVEGLEPANDLRIGNTNAHETWTYAGRRYYAFTESGYFDVTESGKVDIAIIGGGGSGGVGINNFATGGGGGAGAFVEYYDVTLPTGNYLVYIGNGGTGRYGGISPSYTSNGEYSRLTGPPTFSGPTPPHHPAANIIQAPGGGGGGASQVSPSPFFNVAGQNGGSGGGSVSDSSTFGSGEYEKGWGHPGSNSPGLPTGGTGAGGGGGAGGTSGHDAYYIPTGARPTNSDPPSAAYRWFLNEDYGVIGGGGKYMFGGDQGIPTSYGTPGPGVGRYFAGGGDGASDTTTMGGVASPGGGAHELTPGADHNGQKNTGGGGGGSWQDGTGPLNMKAGDGGSGIMIIRFKYFN